MNNLNIYISLAGEKVFIPYHLSVCLITITKQSDLTSNKVILPGFLLCAPKTTDNDTISLSDHPPSPPKKKKKKKNEEEAKLRFCLRTEIQSGCGQAFLRDFEGRIYR